MNPDQAQHILSEIKERWRQIELGIDFDKLKQDLNSYIKDSENPNLWDDPILPAAFYCVSADAPRAQIKRFNVVTQYRLSGTPILPQLRAHGHVVCKAM